jgi:uncharacterized protein involved in exopolysaccharide biosynthesis
MHGNQLGAVADREGRAADSASDLEAAAGRMNLLDLLIVLAKRKITVLLFVAGFAAGMLIVSLVEPGYYSSTTTILPPKQASSGLASMLKSQAGGLADLGEDLGLVRENQTLFVALLESHRVTDALVGRFDLQKVYDVSKRQKAVEQLAQQTDITPKQGLIAILVRDVSRDRAAAIANGYVEELYKLNQDLAITEAAQRRVFFQKQLESAKDDLLKAELDLKRTQESTRLIEVDSQGKAIIEGVARLKAQVTAGEVELRSMLLSATDENPAVVRQREKLAALRSQLAAMESAGPKGGQPSSDGIQIPTNQIPEAEFEYIRALREVKYREALFDMIAKQLEAARLDEAKSAPLVQVVDRAVASQKSLWPDRLLQVIVGGLIGLFIALAWVLGTELVERLRQSPEQNARIEVLLSYLKTRKPLRIAGEGKFQ